TRDVIREKIIIDGLPIQLVDTAGLRKTEDEVEQEGIKRSLSEIEKADRVLYVIDSTLVPLSDLESLNQIDFLKNLSLKKRLTVIRNKIDLCGEKANLRQEADFDVIN